jgi:hypothetical protein
MLPPIIRKNGTGVTKMITKLPTKNSVLSEVSEKKQRPQGEFGEVVTVMQMHNVNLPYWDRVWWEAVENTAPKFKGAGSISRRHQPMKSMKSS